MAKITERGGWRIESDGGRFRICIDPAQVGAAPELKPLNGVCSPWFSLADVGAESKRFWNRVRGWFGKKD